ncbi:SRPBCC family protein [Mycolicibacterium tusciae]|uniref:Polyketide cyclase n=1 Tax=Mycolicibacterium tusciae TaxID=75922 RepID=A0A1X0JH14_9MYCO|nr:SRPBCC family protein [Mycolicibacterium tusciae]ORB62193.1 polyketide cyclase [Mycolicibacterium tusciae]
MPTVSRTFSVSPSPHQVIEYLKDFAQAVEWDPGTQQCTRNDSGPIGEGASWHNVSKIAGITAELTYTLETMSDSNLVFVGKNKSSTSTENIYVDAANTGSVITYRNDLEMRGPIALLNPLLKLYFEKLANDTEKQLISVLNRLYIEEKK